MHIFIVDICRREIKNKIQKNRLVMHNMLSKNESVMYNPEMFTFFSLKMLMGLGIC